MWISRVGGKRKRESRIPRTGICLRETGARGQNQIRFAAERVSDRRAPEPGHAEKERVIFPQAALAHQRVGNGNFQSFREILQFRRGMGRHHSATRIQKRSPGV